MTTVETIRAAEIKKIAKEKAIKLRDDFRDENYNFEAETLSAAKSTALQVVDIIIEENHFLDNFQVEFTGKLVKRLEYWQQVKIELQAL